MLAYWYHFFSLNFVFLRIENILGNVVLPSLKKGPTRILKQVQLDQFWVGIFLRRVWLRFFFFKFVLNTSESTSSF